ncbi:cytochrome c1 [Aristophania vespae]|uniref:cytochrome c1 n=1 Tax=Aristophania vespae TaxID=2697033 RepID=UPI0023511E0E|nr:cytochrome c1 [Aristophania vespae]UMM63744.1 Cytochrome c1 [Aristophania vespae]
MKFSPQNFLYSALLSSAFLGCFSSQAAADTSTQHGFYVFQKVCMDCHGMTDVHYGDMAKLGIPLSYLKEWAESRHATLKDPIASPFPTIEAAKAAYGDAPPDMSQLARYIKGGPSYIEEMLKSYESAPKDLKLGPNSYYNPVALTHHKIFRMPYPFMKETMTYPDGKIADVPQMAQDVTQFLNWAAAPQNTNRSIYGAAILLYLAIMLGLLISLKKMIP